MKTTALRFSCATALSLGMMLHAGEATPPVPTPSPAPAPTPAPAEQPKPPTPPTITVKPTGPVNPNADLLDALKDLLNADATKHEAATKVLVGKGVLAHRSLGQYLNHPDATIVKRIKDVRTAIEQRGIQLFQDVNTLQGKLLSGPLTQKALEEVRAAWITIGGYAPQPELRQNATQAVQQIQAMIGQIDEANKLIASTEKSLAAEPPPGPIQRTAIHMERAQAFTTLQRIDDALKAAKDAFDAGGRESRHAAAALKLQAEMFSYKGDSAGVEAVCKLLAEYANSIEARHALTTLVDVFTEHKRWDDAVDAAKNFVKSCPLDEEAQSSADNLLDTLMEKERDYPRAYGLSTWLKQHLPLSRVRPEVLKVVALCSEYPLKDFDQAESAYKTLAAAYADIVQAGEIDGVMKRVRAKAEKKFPREPLPTDDGPTGALGQYLAAVRARDKKQLAAVAPTAEAEETVGKLTCEDCELIHTITFGDFIVKKHEITGDKAVISIDYFDTASNTPRAIVQHAVKENNTWRIQWVEPDEQLNPRPAPTPNPAVPTPPAK